MSSSVLFSSKSFSTNQNETGMSVVVWLVENVENRGVSDIRMLKPERNQKHLELAFQLVWSWPVILAWPCDDHELVIS